MYGLEHPLTETTTTHDVENSGPDLGQEQKNFGLNRFIGSEQYICKVKPIEMKRFSLILIYVT